MAYTVKETRPPNYRELPYPEKCCITCAHSEQGYEGELNCNRYKTFGSITELGLCDKWKKETEQ